MAFKKSGLYIASAGFGETNINIFTYLNASDSSALMKTSGYFPAISNLQLNDFVFAVASDGPHVLYVSAIDPIVVSNVNDHGISYISATHDGVTTGSNNDIFTIKGVTSRDKALALIQGRSANQIESALCSTNQVQVWYEGSPPTGQNVFISVFRNT